MCFIIKKCAILFRECDRGLHVWGLIKLQVCVRAFVSRRAREHLCAHLRVYVRMSMCVYVCVSARVGTCVCVYVYVRRGNMGQVDEWGQLTNHTCARTQTTLLENYFLTVCSH